MREEGRAGEREGEETVPRGGWRSRCLQGARSPSDTGLSQLLPPPPHPIPALLPHEPQPGLGVWGKGKPTWQMGPAACVSVGARVSVHLVEGAQAPGTAWPPIALERQALHAGLGEVGVEPVSGAPRQGCSCPPPRLGHLQLCGQAQKDELQLVCLPPLTLPIKEGHRVGFQSWVSDSEGSKGANSGGGAELPQKLLKSPFCHPSCMAGCEC